MPRVIRFSGRTEGFGAAFEAWEERPLVIPFGWTLVRTNNNKIDNLPSRKVSFGPPLLQSTAPSEGMNHQKHPLNPSWHLWAPILVR